jgi:hypothetical protein
MAFNFNWSPLAADTHFYNRTKDLLTRALNKEPKPPIIVDDILVSDFSLGSVPPDLEILEIGDLAEDRFRGIFKMCYSGDASVTLKTRVQVGRTLTNSCYPWITVFRRSCCPTDYALLADREELAMRHSWAPALDIMSPSPSYLPPRLVPCFPQRAYVERVFCPSVVAPRSLSHALIPLITRQGSAFCDNPRTLIAVG